jgi:putative two-component system response regulator
MANILVVDDEEAIRKTTRINLESSGFTVHTAENGRDAMTVLAPNYLPVKIDCILLDIRMPGINGMDLLKEIHLMDSRIPVVMMTAMNDLETGLDAMRSGAFDYVTKPVRKQRLLTALERALKYRHIQMENQRLEQENAEYQRSLEIKVQERTRELIEAYKKLQRHTMETVKVLAETIEAKDHYTRGHCNRVRQLSRELAGRAGVNTERLETVEYGALLHDIGKIGIPEALLLKNGTLTDDELVSFRLHPVIGEKILRNVAFFEPCLSIVRQHHERYDGNGYPDGLRGDEIDILSRVVTIADSYDAMTSTRPYRRALPIHHALAELDAGAGSQFDAELVRLFVRWEIYTTAGPI